VFCMLIGVPPFMANTDLELFKRILLDEVKFLPTDNVGEEFKTLIKKHLLNKDYNKRMTVEQALAHPWVASNNNSEEISSGVIDKLKAFQYKNRLKKELAKTLANNMTKDTMSSLKDKFNTIDEDGNGFLDVEELVHFLKRELEYNDNEAYAEAGNTMLRYQHCLDPRGISFEQFVEDYQRNLLHNSEDYMRQVFNVIDKDGNGDIDAEELQMILQLEDSNLVQDIIKEVDGDSDGRIDFDEFKKAMSEDAILGLDKRGAMESAASFVKAM